jgi:hypothetical protein
MGSDTPKASYNSVAWISHRDKSTVVYCLVDCLVVLRPVSVNLPSSAAISALLLKRYGRILQSLFSKICTKSTYSDDYNWWTTCVVASLLRCHAKKMSRVQTSMEILTWHTYILDKKRSDDAADLKFFRLRCVRRAYGIVCLKRCIGHRRNGDRNV